MKRQNVFFPLALALTMLLAAGSAQAQRGRGGHGGGGHSGGHGGHGGRGGHGVVIVGGGWGWGWGWGWGYPGWYGYPGYYYGEGGGYGPAGRWAAIDTDIAPEEALVYLDGKYIGTADDFDGNPDYLFLGPGHYRIEFRLDGYRTVTKEVDAQPGQLLDFKDRMPKIEGAKQYGTYNPPRLEGPIRRYFAKRRGAHTATAIDPSGPPPEVSSEGSDDTDSADVYAPAPAPPASREPRRRASGDEWRGSRSDRNQVRTRLRLTVEPSDAAVYVDNRFVGTAEEVNSMEQGVSVSPGRHTVTVSRPGFREKSVEITAEEGKTGSLEVSLSR